VWPNVDSLIMKVEEWVVTFAEWAQLLAIPMADIGVTLHPFGKVFEADNTMKGLHRPILQVYGLILEMGDLVNHSGHALIHGPELDHGPVKLPVSLVVSCVEGNNVDGRLNLLSIC